MVAHVPEEEPQPRLVGIELLHLVLLQLVPAEDDDAARLMVGQNGAYEAPSERPRSPGDEDGSATEGTVLARQGGSPLAVRSSAWPAKDTEGTGIGRSHA